MLHIVSENRYTDRNVDVYLKFLIFQKLNIMTIIYNYLCNYEFTI